VSIPRWGSPVVVALAAANAALFLGYLATARYRVPFMDALYFLHATLSDDIGLWDLFGGQRHVVMRLLSRADMALFAGSDALFLIVCLAGLAAVIAVMVALALRLPDRPGLREVAAALAVVLCCRCYTLEAYVWSHGVNNVVVSAAVASALALAALVARPGPLIATVIVVLALLATATLANGALVWPLLLAIAWARRANFFVLAALALMTLVALAGVLAVTSPSREGADPLAALSRPGEVIEYVVRFLGIPWSRGGAPLAAGLALGTAMLAAGAWAVATVPAQRARFRLDPADALCAALLAYVIGTALMTALVRIDFGPAQAVQSRYGAIVMVAHAAAALFVLKRLAPVFDCAVMVAVVVFCGAIGIEQVAAGELFRWQARTLDEAGLALVAGSREDSLLRRIYPEPEIAREALARAKARRVSLFRDPAAQRIGGALAASGLALAQDRCDGAVESAWRRGDGEWELAGWVQDRVTKALPDTMLVADADGTVIGFGRLDQLRRELPVKFGWRAIAVGGGGIEGWTVWGVWRGGFACRVPGAVRSAPR